MLLDWMGRLRQDTASCAAADANPFGWTRHRIEKANVTLIS
jgi:hypothetical protein